MKPQQQTYTVKEFSLNPSRAIHRALGGVEVIISLRGVPAVRLVPVAPPGDRTDEILASLAALPGFQVAQCRPWLPAPTIRLSGEGPSASEMLLEDRR